jgi:predicted PurR-regulated permease PerM
MKLHPVTIMLGLLIFQHFFGIIGMIVATPVIAAGKVIFTYIDEKINIIGKITGENKN